MISRVEGELVAVMDGVAEVRNGAFTLEVLVPAADEQFLATQVGELVSFHTILYLEGQSQGASFYPRLIGFGSAEQREFFELFTTVKGIGNRKALRAMQLPFGAIAAAIANKDTGLLTSLPEIGRRTAETIVAQLHGKVDRFVELKPGATGMDGRAGSPGAPGSRLIADAIAVLVQFGEPRIAAIRLVDRALIADPTISSPDALVAAVYRLKEAG